MNQLELRCIVTTPTHQESILDHIITDAEFYSNCQLQPPKGLSKHKCVVTIPDSRPDPLAQHTRIFRPFRDSSIRKFGQWIVSHEWSDISMIEDVDETTGKLLNLLSVQFDKCFSRKKATNE